MKALHMIAFILTAVGGINWGLIGLSMLSGGNGTEWNVVNMLLGSSPETEAAVYILIGVSAVWVLIGHKNDCKVCR